MILSIASCILNGKNATDDIVEQNNRRKLGTSFRQYDILSDVTIDRVINTYNGVYAIGKTGTIRIYFSASDPYEGSASVYTDFTPLIGKKISHMKEVPGKSKTTYCKQTEETTIECAAQWHIVTTDGTTVVCKLTLSYDGWYNFLESTVRVTDQSI